MQLNIFDDSRDVMLRNDVVNALERRDASAVMAALNKFTEEFPLDETLPALCVLADAMGQRSGALFVHHNALRDALHVLDHDIEPSAKRVFGTKAGTEWLTHLWRELACRSAQLPFHANDCELHAAPLWLRACNWEAADNAVESIPSWRRIPAPLAWKAEARYRADGLETAWALLCELAWISPSRFDHLTKQLADPSLTLLRKKFDASFEGDGDVADLAWFPAWVLTEKPALSRPLGETMSSSQTAPERAMRLLLQLLSLERQGRHTDILDRRKALRDLQPSLYAVYMKTR